MVYFNNVFYGYKVVVNVVGFVIKIDYDENLEILKILLMVDYIFVIFKLLKIKN